MLQNTLQWGLYHARLLVTADIPWWLYIMAGIALAIVSAVSIPGRAGLALAALCLLISGDVGFYTMASASMHAADLLEFKREGDAERARLQEAFDKQLAQERSRADDATEVSARLQQEVNDVVKQLPPATDGNGTPSAVIPAAAAHSLRLIGGANGGSRNAPAGRAKGAPAVRGVLRLHSAVPSP